MFDAKRKYEVSAAPGYVVIIRDEAKDATKGGLLLPAQAQEVPKVGTVISHFPGSGYLQLAVGKRSAQELTLEKGTRVVFQPHAGYDFTYSGETFLLLNEADVMAEIEEGK